MTKNQTQSSPQLILWMKEAGVFKTAQLKMPEYPSYNLEKNVEVGDRDISPNSLNLINSTYLGSIHIFEERLGCDSSENSFERLKKHKYMAVDKIVKLAENFARRQVVPYFGVNMVQIEKYSPLKFTEIEDIVRMKKDLFREFVKIGDSFDKDLKGKVFLINKINQPDKINKPEPLDFVLNLTAQLYVLRE